MFIAGIYLYILSQRFGWGKRSLARIALPIMVFISLVLGVSLAYSILYIYPYARGAPLQPHEKAAEIVMTVIPEAPTPTYSVEGGAGSVVNISTALKSNTTPLALPTAEGLRTDLPPGATPAPMGAGIRSIEITNISIEGGRIYLRLRLTMVGEITASEKISIVRVSLTPLPFPYGWNGSSWVYGPEEDRCLVRVSTPIKILAYSYRVFYEGERRALVDLELRVDKRTSIYGPYELSIVLEKDSRYINIAGDVPLGGYRNPPGSPPHEILEKASTCS